MIAFGRNPRVEIHCGVVLADLKRNDTPLEPEDYVLIQRSEQRLVVE